MMIKQKQHFIEGEEVIIHSLDNTGREYEGIICGKCDMVLMDNYIVRIIGDSFRKHYPFSCVQITEACLRRKNL